MIEYSNVNPEMVEVVWDKIVPFIDKAIAESNGELLSSEIKKKAIAGSMLIRIVFEDWVPIAVVTYEQRVFQSGMRVLNICTAGGEKVDLWFKDVDEYATELAKKHNCSEVYIIGRKGWDRKMKHLGYGHVHTVLSREV